MIIKKFFHRVLECIMHISIKKLNLILYNLKSNLMKSMVVEDVSDYLAF